MSENYKNKQVLIEIYNKLDENEKPIALNWEWYGINGEQALQILQTAYNAQLRRNIKKEILEEINKTKVYKPSAKEMMNANLRI